MDALKTLNKMKTELLGQISNAAQQGKSELVVFASEKLGQVESLIRRYEQIVYEISVLEGQGTEPSNIETPKKIRRKPMHISFDSGSKSGREIGREIRRVFLRKLADASILLQPVEGSTIYETNSGNRIGVAVATERQPDRWFLGLQDGKFTRAILLCQRENGEILELYLEKDFFNQWGPQMSKSNGQIKFNIVRRGSRYFIQVPGTDGIRILELPYDKPFLR